MSILAILATIAGGLVSLSIIYRLVVKPAVRAAKTVEILSGIAAEFRPDHNTTLKDQFNAVEEQVQALKSSGLSHSLNNEKFEAYVHTTMRVVLNALTVIRELQEVQSAGILPEPPPSKKNRDTR